MRRISIQIDSPRYVKVSQIANELLEFSSTIEEKYSQIDFEFAFCFRALHTLQGIRSRVRFYKDEEPWLGMDLMMALDEFNPYKKNVSMQRLIMGKHFFPFFTENIKKYKRKLPVLKPVAEDLIEDMRLFLINNLWLPDDDGKLKLSVIETVPYQRVLELFGKSSLKKFTDNNEGLKIQDITWIVEENTKLSARYLLEDKIWKLVSYSIDENPVEETCSQG